MPRLSNLAFALSVALFAGCAATVNRSAVSEPALSVSPVSAKRIVMVVKGSGVATASKDWEPLRAEWKTAMTSAATAAGVDFVYQESEPARYGQPATLVVVNVNDYRYISPGARFGLGIMTGNAYMDADAEFYDMPSRRTIGKRKYSTSSSAWQGVFSAMTSKQIEAISTEIVREVAQR